MDEYIKKAELWNERPEWLNQIMQREVDSAHNQGWNECNDEWLNIIKSMPTIEITHCSECKFWKGGGGVINAINGEIYHWCEKGHKDTLSDWFCADGVRKTRNE